MTDPGIPKQLFWGVAMDRNNPILSFFRQLASQIQTALAINAPKLLAEYRKFPYLNYHQHNG